MAARFVRASKFKHVFGKAYRKDSCFDNIRITKSNWDSTYCDANPKFVAIITEVVGGGAFLVLPLDKIGRVERDVALVAGHRGPVLDIQWCPHNDNRICSTGEDCTIKVWDIPDDGLTENLTEPLVSLSGHQRKVGIVLWHPTAANILLSAGTDNLIYIWNLETGEPVVEIGFPDLITCVSFNNNGSKLVATCKDKITRVINPRTGEVLREGQLHEGSKTQRVAYVNDDRLFTTGFSRMSDRQYALWDDNDLTKPLAIEDIDQSNGILFPFFDRDTGMIYLCGKGDSNIRYYEIVDDNVFYLNTYSSSEPQRGIGFMPKRGVDTKINEVARIFKLHSKGLCEIISFTVPRKSELFQVDLYPDTAAAQPAVSADEWLQGKDADPVKISMIPDDANVTAVPQNKGLVSTGHSTKKIVAAAVASSEKVDNQNQLSTIGSRSATITNGTGSGTTTAIAINSCSSTPSVATSLPVEVQHLLEDMRKMKIIIKGHERRIKELEARTSDFVKHPDETEA